MNLLIPQEKSQLPLNLFKDIKLLARDYQVIVIEDACSAHKNDIHQNPLELIRKIALLKKAEELP